MIVVGGCHGPNSTVQVSWSPDQLTRDAMSITERVTIEPIDDDFKKEVLGQS